MVADRRLGQTDRLVQVARTGFTGSADDGQQLQPGRIRKGFEDPGELLRPRRAAGVRPVEGGIR